MNTRLKQLIALIFTILTSNSAHALIDDPLNPIRLFAIFHDDVPESKRSSVYPDFIRPFVIEFEKITGRKISVVFDRSRPPYTNFNYKSETPDRMFEDWKKLTWQYRTEQHNDNEFLVSDNDRILLITNDYINGSSLTGGLGGLASQPGNSAIASLGNQQVLGHELGHTFNATHESSEIVYNGWWCETFMYPTAFILRSNCLVFSEGNRKRIKNYVDSRY